MLTYTWLSCAVPLASSCVLAVLGRRLPRLVVTALGVVSVALAAALAVAIAAQVLSLSAPLPFRQLLWPWMRSSYFSADVALLVDPLSLTMMLVVTVVGFLIHLYAALYMAHEEDLSRFFASMNLFIASMLVLVLADNLVLLLLGWEGVGLCSYLLIGFWYRDKQNGDAALKAFIVTHIGDAALLLGIVLLFWATGSTDIRAITEHAPRAFTPGGPVVSLAAFLLLGGAVGKSAQLPLQTWLPDAMAGPTPVSALIHAATMVTAGVYLIARMHVLFELAPVALSAVAVIGALTLLVGGLAALGQSDIKRVLAYSTMSQIGYMFLGLGVGAYSAAIFHLVTHAFFKALLFLAAGAVIHCQADERDVFRMGGLCRRLPFVCTLFVIGGASLAGLPLVTAGFFSKDAILFGTFRASEVLWAGGILGALLTGLYIFRVIFLVFGGPQRITASGHVGWQMSVPMAILACLSIIGGVVNLPPVFGGNAFLSRFLAPVLPDQAEQGGRYGVELGVSAAAAVAAIAGLTLALRWFLRRRPEEESVVGIPHLPRSAGRFLASGLGFDAVYGAGFVDPYVVTARLNMNDAVDLFFRLLAALARAGNRVLARAEDGRTRRYAAVMAAGLALLLLTVLT